MPIIDGLAGFQNPAPTGLAAIGSKVPFIIPGESVNATLVLKMHYRNVIAVLVCSAGLIHQHSLNYSLLNREIRKHSKHKFKLNLIVTKVNVVRYQNYMSVESDFAECRGGWREDLHRLTLYTFRLPTRQTGASQRLSDRYFIYCHWWPYRDALPGFRRTDSGRH